MSQIADIETIVSRGLCIGCGLCVSVLGEASLKMKITTAGRLRPIVVTALSEPEMDQVRAVCPGVRVTAPKLSSSGPIHPLWGPIRTTHRGWAGDPDIRFTSAAGGSLTALGAFLLETGKVDAVLHVRASKSNPMLTDALVSTSRADVISGAQSRYGPSAPLVHVNRLLDAGRTFAVIGKPCDVAAIRNLATIDARVAKQIPYCLTIFCGGLPSSYTAEKISRYHGVEPDQVSVFRFRGKGWPGPTRVETKTGETHDLTYRQTWFDSSVPWDYDIQFRCKICPDAIGELGDIACPDGWVLKDGKTIHEEAPGVNVLIARTPIGEQLVADAAAARALRLAPFAAEELDVMHNDHFPRKLENPARIAAMRLAGEPVPDFRNFRFWWTVLHAGVLRQLRGFAGTWRRIRRGANREPIS
jgi:coenzyme F420 hydrogenase subunit beta